MQNHGATEKTARRNRQTHNHKCRFQYLLSIFDIEDQQEYERLEKYYEQINLPDIYRILYQRIAG